MRYDDMIRNIRLSGYCVIGSLLLLLGACSIAPQARETPVSYDLGPQRVHAAADATAKMVLMVPAAVAPALLDNPGIVYRLAYVDAARPQVYAQSRWADSPAALLTQRVRNRFAAAGPVVSNSDGARADYALRIELEDFSQSFDAADRSRVNVRVRVTLINQASRAIRAQRSFSLERAAAPNAEGAARALAEAADAVIESMLEWTTASLKAG